MRVQQGLSCLPPGPDLSTFTDLLSDFLIENRLLLLSSFPFLSVQGSIVHPNNHIFHFPPTRPPCSFPLGLGRIHKRRCSRSHSPCSPASRTRFRMGSWPHCHSHKTWCREWPLPSALGMRCSSGPAGSRLDQLRSAFV